MSQTIDFRYVLRVVRRRILLFLLPALALAVVGTAIVMSLPAIYTADAKILVETQQIPDELVKSTVTDQASERIQVIQQRVLTRENLLTLVDKFQLFANRTNLNKTEIVDLMRDRIAFLPVEMSLGSARRPNQRVATAFAIEFNYERPDTVVKVVNELVTFILDEDARSRTGRASETTRFLQRETERVTNELAKVQSEISDFKLQNTETLPEKLAFNMSLLERTEKTITDLQRELISNDEQQRLVKLEVSIRSSNANGALVDPEAELRKKLEEAKIQYAVQKQVLAESHPEMRAMKRSIAAWEAQLSEESANKEPGAATPPVETSANQQLLLTRLETLTKGRKVTEDELAKNQKTAEKLRAVVVKTPESGAALAALERRETAIQRNLDEMSTKLGQAQLGERMEQDQQAERFQVIEQPVVPSTPTKPKRVELLAAVWAASIGLGAATSVGAELLNNTIRRSSDIVQQLKQYPLAVIPYIQTKSELRKRRRRLWLIIAFWALVFALALILIHNFYRPLDEIYFRIIQIIRTNL